MTPLSALRVYKDSSEYDDYSLSVIYDPTTNTYRAETDLPTRIDGTSEGEGIIGEAGTI